MKRKSSAAKKTAVSRPRTCIDASVELMLPYKGANSVDELKVVAMADSCKTQSVCANKNQKKRRRRHNKKRFD